MDFGKAPDGAQAAEVERLITAYGDSILRLCFVYLGDMALAEDAAQETFLKVYRQFSTFRQESAEKTWMVRIAINTCKDMRRASWFRRVDRSVTLDMVPEPLCDFDPADDTLITSIMALPPRLKDVVLLKYYQGLGLQQIAGVLGIPVGTVSTRLNAAKKKLRAKLERWYFDE